MDVPLQFNRNVGRPPIVKSSDDMDIQDPGSVDSDTSITTAGPGTAQSLQRMSGIGPQVGPHPYNGPAHMMAGSGQMMTGASRMMGSSNQNMTSSGSMMAGNGQMMPGGGQIMPGGGQMMPGGGQMMPGGGQMMPGSGQMMPGSGQMMPGSGQMTMPTSGYNMGREFDMMMGDPYMMNVPQEVDGKEVLNFNGFILVPPPSHAPPRSTREKPPGCKTLFVGGLPETVTEEMIGELMQTCGVIETIRLGKKYFAHVRFTDFESVDKAIFYSGWRMKIGDKDDKPNTGRIHCDYATARDDQYEWECMQRTIEREQRHQRRMMLDMNRPPSPPQVARYSESEASNLTDMLKTSEVFSEAAATLMQWLDKGQVTSRNANRFYTMIHCVQSSVRRLTNEKEEFEQELVNYKAQYKTKVTGLVHQMEQIQNVFSKARQQKVWDHFSKPQRKNLELWTVQCQKLKQKHDDELLAERQEDEMDLSDTESSAPASKKSKLTAAVTAASNLNKLSDENDSLKCQLEAYKNEVDMNKQEAQAELMQKSKQIAMLQQTLKGMQQQLMSTRNEITALQKKHNKQLAASKSASTKEGSDESRGAEGTTESKETIEGSAEGSGEETTEELSGEQPVVEVTDLTGDDDMDEDSSSVVKAEPLVKEEVAMPAMLKEQEGQLLGLIVCFLHVHPFGASIDYIWSYLKRGGIDVKSSQIETLLEGFPNMFSQKICGVGVNFEKRWVFIGFPSGEA